MRISMKEVLTNARANIVNKGWCQGGNGTGPEGQVCALNALDDIVGSHRSHEACIFLRSVLHHKLGQNRPVSNWNDEQGRTVEEVLMLYDIAIASCDER